MFHFISTFPFITTEDLEVPLSFEVSGLNLPTVVEGDEIIYTAPSGAYAHATVLAVEFDESVGIDGEWCIRIEFTTSGGLTFQTWTGLDAIEVLS